MKIVFYKTFHNNLNRGIFLYCFLCMYFIQHCFICRPSDSTVSAVAGMEPRTVATSALAVRRSNHSARSHPCLGYISSTIIKTNISRTIFRWGNVVNNRAMFRSSGKDCLGPVWHTRKDVWMSWDPKRRRLCAS